MPILFSVWDTEMAWRIMGRMNTPLLARDILKAAMFPSAFIPLHLNALSLRAERSILRLNPADSLSPVLDGDKRPAVLQNSSGLRVVASATGTLDPMGLVHSR